MSTVYTRTKDLLVEKFGIDDEEVRPDATFEELDLDSLDLVEFALAAEEEFGVRISDEEAEEFETLGDAVSMVESRLATVSG
jgi:acyl carrier protein